MILSQIEKKQLLNFIKSHYVDYHDVRLLIARDLEEDISQQMKEDEELSFEEALEKAYKKYGVIGFSDASEEYMKKINTYFYKKVIFKVVKDEASTLRFWLLAVMSFLIIYSVITSLITMPFVLAGGFIVLIILGLIFYFRKLHKEIKELKKNDNYYYLDQLLISNNSILFPFTYIPFMLAPHIGGLTENEAFSMAILAFFTMISFIAYYLIYFRLYKDRSEILKAYKETFLKNKLDYKLEVI
ncbi:hypothetical protein [Psychroflexus sediminis]|uniref:Uncharacterized protein n=1 Tax=Psychroflexus sediminis TaxID=470826 RepID=A0A1G7Y3X5_9FLAO|nr:hypothetical protein [Psychroflexus sediminis]SDG91124.1 hypothetical protein SAMN04488027_110113 [Psychroflexus sediminis]